MSIWAAAAVIVLCMAAPETAQVGSAGRPAETYASATTDGDGQLVIVTSAGTVHVHLTRPQARVLFEFLARTDDKGEQPLAVSHPGEEHVLWVLEGQLEQALGEVFDPKYDELVAMARAQVMANE